MSRLSQRPSHRPTHPSRPGSPSAPTLRVLLFLALACIARPLSGQETPVPDRAELDGAIESHETRADLDRAVLSRVLSHPEVQRAASGAGMESDLERARVAVPTLASGPLRQAAEHARSLETQLAGGQTLSISTTTIILILLIIVIIILIAD